MLAPAMSESFACRAWRQTLKFVGHCSNGRRSVLATGHSMTGKATHFIHSVVTCHLTDPARRQVSISRRYYTVMIAGANSSVQIYYEVTDAGWCSLSFQSNSGGQQASKVVIDRRGKPLKFEVVTGAQAKIVTGRKLWTRCENIKVFGPLDAERGEYRLAIIKITRTTRVITTGRRPGFQTPLGIP